MPTKASNDSRLSISSSVTADSPSQQSSLDMYHTCYFQDLYRVLLEADSEGILDDVDLEKVEELILLRKK